MLFHSSRKKLPDLVNLKMGSKSIKRTKYVIFLGILVDEHLSWKTLFYTRGIPGLFSPTALAGDNLRPDFRLITHDKCLYILELTVGLGKTYEIFLIGSNSNIKPSLGKSSRKSVKSNM